MGTRKGRTWDGHLGPSMDEVMGGVTGPEWGVSLDSSLVRERDSLMDKRKDVEMGEAKDPM